MFALTLYLKHAMSSFFSVRTKRACIIAVAVGVFLILSFAFRAELGVLVWDIFRMPRAAFFLNPDVSLAMAIGNYYFNGGAYDLGQAARAYKKALATDPNVRLAHYQLARIHFLQSDFFQALSEINKELELHPELPNIYYVRGLIQGYARNFSEAEADFLEFIKRHERPWAAYNDLAWIYFQQGRFFDVKEAALRGLQIEPRSPWLLTSLGVALLNLNEKQEARKVLLAALGEAERLTPEEWGRAYPGNDPRIYAQGLEAMRGAIRKNLELVSN